MKKSALFASALTLIAGMSSAATYPLGAVGVTNLLDSNIDGTIEGVRRDVAFTSIQNGGTAGFVDRKYFGFVSFNLATFGTFSVSSAVFSAGLNDPVSTGTPGKINVYAQAVGTSAGAEDLGNALTLLDSFTSPTKFTSVAYSLDITSVLNSFLGSTFGSGDRMALRFEAVDDIDDVPGGTNAGYGVRVSLGADALSFTAGPPPAVPLPAGAVLLVSGLAVFAVRRRLT